MNQDTGEELSHVPKTAEIPPHYIALWDKHNEYPVSEEIWDHVIDLARAEESTERAKLGAYGTVPLDSLLQLRDKIRQEPTSTLRYKILTEQSPTGKLWFDTLVGISSPAIIGALKDRISQKHWDKGLDIGTGTGNLTRALRPYCNNLVSLDRADFLLRIARERLGKKGHYVQADALKLPFPDNTFDFAASSGVTHSLTKSELLQYAIELGRVLKKGASYFDSYLFPPEGEVHRDYKKSLANIKGILADMILDEVTGVSLIDSNDKVKNFPEFVQIFQLRDFSLGLHQDTDRNVLLIEFTKN